MSTCIHHPDRDTRFHCVKHRIYLCEACLECRDPELFCKHRSACPIWFMTRKKKHLGDEEPTVPSHEDPIAGLRDSAG